MEKDIDVNEPGSGVVLNNPLLHFEIGPYDDGGSQSEFSGSRIRIDRDTFVVLMFILGWVSLCFYVDPIVGIMVFAIFGLQLYVDRDIFYYV